MKIQSYLKRRCSGAAGQRLKYDVVQGALSSYEGCSSLHLPLYCSLHYALVWHLVYSDMCFARRCENVNLCDGEVLRMNENADESGKFIYN
jgi:hypothetical protein